VVLDFKQISEKLSFFMKTLNKNVILPVSVMDWSFFYDNAISKFILGSQKRAACHAMGKDQNRFVEIITFQ